MHRRATSPPVVTGLVVAALAAIASVATSSACDTAGRTAAAPATLAACAPAVTASAPAPSLPVSTGSLSHPAIPLYLAVNRAPAPALGGMIAHLDPETGEIGGMPTPRPAALDFASPEGLTVEDLVEEQAWDGSWMVNLRGLFQEYAVVRLDGSGRPVLSCGPDARVMLAAPLPAAPVVEE